MDPLTIILIVAAVLVGLGLLWAAVAIVTAFLARKAVKDVAKAFDVRHDFFTRN